MSAATKRALARETVQVADACLIRWQQAMGRGDVEIRDCSPVVDAILEMRHAATMWAPVPATKRKARTS